MTLTFVFNLVELIMKLKLSKLQLINSERLLNRGMRWRSIILALCMNTVRVSAKTTVKLLFGIARLPNKEMKWRRTNLTALLQLIQTQRLNLLGAHRNNIFNHKSGSATALVIQSFSSKCCKLIAIFF